MVSINEFGGVEKWNRGIFEGLSRRHDAKRVDQDDWFTLPHVRNTNPHVLVVISIIQYQKSLGVSFDPIAFRIKYVITISVTRSYIP